MNTGFKSGEIVGKRGENGLGRGRDIHLTEILRYNRMKGGFGSNTRSFQT